MQACMNTGMQLVCKYVSVGVFKDAIMVVIRNVYIEVWIYASIKHANIQVCNFARHFVNQELNEKNPFTLVVQFVTLKV